MSSELNSTQRNLSQIEAQLRNSRYDLEQQQERETRERIQSHAERMQQLEVEQRRNMDALRKDFDVQLSKEAGILEERLQEIRDRNEELLTQEKNWGDQELKKIKEATHQSLERAESEADTRLFDHRQQLKDAETAQYQQLKESVRNHRKGS